MKKTAIIMALILALACIFTGCTKTEAPAEPSAPAAQAGLANPMVESSAEEIANTLGVTFGTIDGAQNVKYYIISGDLAQMNFTRDGLDYTVRIQPAGEYTDISGAYYEWNVIDDCQIGGRDGKSMRYVSDTEQVEVCEWYDIAPGLMYCVTAGGEGADLDGFDLTAVAQTLFAPVQGEADA